MTKGDAVVAFSGEMTGWQVIVEGIASDAERDALIHECEARMGLTRFFDVMSKTLPQLRHLA